MCLYPGVFLVFATGAQEFTGKHDDAMAHNEKLLVADEEAAAAEEEAAETDGEAAPESAADADAADQLAEQTSQLKV